MDPNRIICNCQAVTAGAIKEAVDSGADTVEEVQGITGAGTVCGACLEEVEKLVKNLHKPEKPKKKLNDDVTMQVIYQDIEDKLKQRLSTKVTVTSKGEGSGKIEIEFYNHDDLDRIIELLSKS